MTDLKTQERKWVSADCACPIFKKEFSLDGFKGAVLNICGLGFFEAYLNDRRISEDLFVPVWSDYEPRRNRRMKYPINDTFTHRVYYLSYEVSSLLKAGRNTLEIWLGDGWYNQNVRNIEGDFRYGQPKLLFELNVTDDAGSTASIVSDETLVYKQSFITSSNIYAGEHQDFRLCNTEDWKQARPATAPEAEMCLQDCPPDRIIRKIRPSLVKKDGNRTVYDAGENLSGFAVFTLHARSGEEVHVRYSEELTADGSLNTSSTGDRPVQEDTFISDGTPRICIPRFTYHGFRYFEADGDIRDVRVYMIHADVAPKASFRCSSEALNLLFEAYMRSQLSNMHTGVVSDCPHRERLGYTGDGQLTADTAMLTLDAEKFYRKWIIDILDCQDMKTGHVQHTAPFYGGGGGPGGWGGAIVFVPYYHYLHYRDRELLARCYPHMKKWVSYMEAHSNNGLVVREEEGGWCLGEWCTPEKVELPEPFVNTYFLIKALQCMQKIARILGASDDCGSEQPERIENAWKEAYYDPDRNTFCNGVQGADAFALDIGMGNEEMLRSLAAKYERTRCFDTGMFGTDILVSVLCRGGYTDLVYDLLTAVGEGTYGYLQNGATTLRERWDGSESHNHHMFGAPVKHLFYSFLGIGFTEGLTIRPNIPKKLLSASAELETVAGALKIHFQKEHDGIDFDITADADCTFIYAGSELILKKGEMNRLHFAVSEQDVL